MCKGVCKNSVVKTHLTVNELFKIINLTFIVSGVFVLTAIWSLLAYVWLLAVLLWITPGEIEAWEAWVTLLFFPLLVLSAYAQDSNWWIKRVSPEPTESCQSQQVTENGKAEPSAQV